MRVLCRHGHLAFYPGDAEDLARFMQILNIKLHAVDDYYTFQGLVLAPRFSIAGMPYVPGGLPATTTCERQYPWQAMQANGFVYNMALGIIVPSAAIISVVSLPQSSYYYLQQSRILQSGERLPTGQQILSYDAEYDRATYQLRILAYE